MIDPGLPLLITAITAAIAALGSIAVSIITLFKVERVHIATNSMKDALVKNAHTQGMQDQKDKTDGSDTLAKASHARGVQDQKDKQSGTT